MATSTDELLLGVKSESNLVLHVMTEEGKVVSVTYSKGFLTNEVPKLGKELKGKFHSRNVTLHAFKVADLGSNPCSPAN